MNTATTLTLAALSLPTLYVASRIVFSAYFAAKHVYQRRLLMELAGEEHGTKGTATQ